MIKRNGKSKFKQKLLTLSNWDNDIKMNVVVVVVVVVVVKSTDFKICDIIIDIAT